MTTHPTQPPAARPGAPPQRRLLSALLALAVRGTGALSTLLVTLIVARVLGATEAGLFFLCYTLLQVVATPARLGLDGPVLRYAGDAVARGNWAAARQVLGMASRWTWLAGTLLALLLLPLAGVLAEQVFHKPALATPLRISLCAVPLLALLPVIASALKGSGRPMAGLATQAILAPAATGLLMLLVLADLLPASASAATIALLAGHGIALLLALAIWQQVPRHGEVSAAPPARALLASAWPMLAASLMTMAVLWSGQLVAAALLPAHELAWLNVAQRLAAVLALPHFSIIATLAAGASWHLSRRDHAGLAALVGPATRTATAMAALPALLMLLFPEPLMALFGEDFRAGGALLAVLVAGQLVNVMTGPAMMLLTVSGHERDIRNLTLGSGALAILLALLLTHAFGVMGAAVAVAAASVIQNLAMLFCVRYRLGFWTLTGRAQQT